MYVICKDIVGFLQDNLKDYKFEIHEIIEYHVDHFNGFRIRPKIPRKKKKKEEIKLDKYDYKILQGVIDNPESSILELSHKIKIDRITLKKHLEKLEEYDYIRILRYVVDNYKIGFTIYMVHVGCTPSQKKKIIDISKNYDYGGSVYETHNGLIFGYICPKQEDVFAFFEKIKNISPIISVEINQTGSYAVNPVPEVVKEFLEEKSKWKN